MVQSPGQDDSRAVYLYNQLARTIHVLTPKKPDRKSIYKSSQLTWLPFICRWREDRGGGKGVGGSNLKKSYPAIPSVLLTHCQRLPADFQASLHSPRDLEHAFLKSRDSFDAGIHGQCHYIPCTCVCAVRTTAPPLSPTPM
ncbi:UNVERIFIED_CONTAM: hypothetical protein K2H54_007427 [Gekko kuhli]